MAEQKKRGRPPAKTTAKTPQVKKTTSPKKGTGKGTGKGTTKGTAKGSTKPKKEAEPINQKEIRRKEIQPRETTKVTIQGTRFGESMTDEIVLIVSIVACLIVLSSLLTDKMGIFGEMLSAFFKGLLGFSGLLLPIFVIVFCIWMLMSEEKRNPTVKVVGAGLFLVTLASAAHLVNPIHVATNAGFVRRCSAYYMDGAFYNGGLIGGLIGGGLYQILDTLGSSMILLTVLLISVVLATGKSFLHALEDANSYRKVRKKAKREKIKQRAEQVRQQELWEEERLQKRAQRRKKMSRKDFNIELEETEAEEMPYIQETVFRQKSIHVEPKKREPIYDYVKEVEQPEKPTAEEQPLAEQAPIILEAGKPIQQPKAERAQEWKADIKAERNAKAEKDSVSAEMAAASMGIATATTGEKTAQQKQERVFPKAESSTTVTHTTKLVFDDTPIIDIMPDEDMGKAVAEIPTMDTEMLFVTEADEAEGFDGEAVFAAEATATTSFADADDFPILAEEEEPLEIETEQIETEPIEADRIEADRIEADAEETKELSTEEIPEVREPEEEELPYQFPPIELLGQDPQTGNTENHSELIENAKKLESTLKSFGVDAKVIQISKGPTVTRYELSPSQGVKVSKIVNLADDIALNLAASGIRMEAPIPGKAAVGIEVPNKETQSVYMRTLLESDAFQEHPSKLAFALGQDIAGNPVVTDIAKMPHLLIAGATGSGKSVCINTLITSILYKADPKEVKLLLVDPKVVELSVYNGIPHLLIPVVTDPKKASSALQWAVREMLQRYQDFAAQGVRDIKGFNKLMEQKGDEKGKMPQIVIVIDELADLMMAAPGEVEDAICRLAQMARAAGMHLIIATQRPSVDVITGVIKANIPSRLAFAVSSGIDSRTILDMVGAEKLLGKGDMLFYPSGQSKPSRLQGAFVTDQEVEAIVSFLKQTSKPYYTQETIDKITAVAKDGGEDDGETDTLYGQAVDLVIEKEKASVSMLQRHFRIGYNRAARLMDDLERRGIVGPEEGSKPRRVLLTKTEWEERIGAVPDEQ